jgi:3-oxoacyl-(acyl-carrier-protein) synthase
MKNSRPKRIAITGLGPLTAIGVGKEELWKSVISGRSNVVLHRQFIEDEYWDSFYLAKLPMFEVESFGFPQELINSLRANRLLEDIDLLYLLATVHLALEDSKLSYNPEDNEIGLILTHENPGVDRYVKQVFQVVMSILDGKSEGGGRKAEGGKTAISYSSKKEVASWLYQQHCESVYNLQSFMYLYQISKAFKLHGYSLFVNNACASGLYALEAASQQIQSGKSQVVIVAGADCPLFITKYLWFKELGLYATDGIMRPFDRDRNGFIFGDGGGALVVEELEHALRRGAFIYAEYLGGGFSQDAWKVSVPDVTGNFYAKAFQQALKNSGIKSEEIDLVNPHGVSTGIGDSYEAKVITDIFGDNPSKPLISAFKPYVGHNLGGSALVELIILLMALQRNLVPPTLNYENPDPRLKIYLGRDLISCNLQTVAKMSNGFAGYNAVGIFRKVND